MSPSPPPPPPARSGCAPNCSSAADPCSPSTLNSRGALSHSSWQRGQPGPGPARVPPYRRDRVACSDADGQLCPIDAAPVPRFISIPLPRPFTTSGIACPPPRKNPPVSPCCLPTRRRDRAPLMIPMPLEGPDDHDRSARPACCAGSLPIMYLAFVGHSLGSPSSKRSAFHQSSYFPWLVRCRVGSG